MTRVVVAGSRDITDTATVHSAIENSEFQPSTLLSGGADGVDAIAEAWADQRDIPTEVYEADWDEHGNAAGPKRNKEMARNADALVLVWDGESPGSRSMLQKALTHRLDVHVEPVGYEGVVKNDIDEEELLRRYPELSAIEDVWIRSEAIEGLLAGHPDYIWEVAASRTGQFHPPDERGLHGQWLHVKRMYYAYDEMITSLQFQGVVSKRQVELGRAAVFYHDLMKNGIGPEPMDSSHSEHDTLAAEYVRNFTDLPEEVARLCDIHNGPWNNDTAPETPHEYVFHMADMVASRNGSNLGVYQPTEELRGISDQLIDLGDI